MKEKGSEIAKEIVAEWKREEYFRKLLLRFKLKKEKRVKK